MVDDFSTARDAVDPLLEALCKRWRYRGAESREDGENVLTYEIRLRKGLSTSSVVSTLMTEGAPAVRRVLRVGNRDAPHRRIRYGAHAEAFFEALRGEAPARARALALSLIDETEAGEAAR